MPAAIVFSPVVGALMATLATSAVQADASEPVGVRVGVVAVEDSAAELRLWEAVFSEMSRKHVPRLKFRIAVGTYGDVLHWMEQELIDVAVLIRVQGEGLGRPEHVLPGPARLWRSHAVFLEKIHVVFHDRS